MKRPTRALLIMVGMGLMLFGGLSMNYSKSSTLKYHQAWAREHGMPGPSRGMFFGGMGAAVIGVVVIGGALRGRG